MKTIEPLDFWKWAFSDFLSNSLRGVLAEYIVAHAINCTGQPRTEWDAYDLRAADGTKIEVKSSAYLQSWNQKQHSILRFDIAQKISWDAKTNVSLQQAARSADVYVFCVFAELDRTKANPLDTSQWFFFVCSANFINEKFKQQKTIRLSSLERHGLNRVLFEQLATEIERCKS